MLLHVIPIELFDIITDYLDLCDKISLMYVTGIRSIKYHDLINEIKHSSRELDIQKMKKVRYMFEYDDVSNGAYNEHLVSSHDVKKFIISIIRMHHTPQNPNDKLLGIKLKFLSIDTPTSEQYMSHWWTSPDLANPDNGAKILGLRHWKERIIYSSAEYNEEHKMEMADYDDGNVIKYISYVDPEYNEYFDMSNGNID